MFGNSTICGQIARAQLRAQLEGPIARLIARAQLRGQFEPLIAPQWHCGHSKCYSAFHPAVNCVANCARAIEYAFGCTLFCE